MKHHPLEFLDPVKLMNRAIELARKSQFQTDPNPIVGAVLTDATGNIISEGYHKRAGAPHAEVMALQSMEQVPKDSVLFVTLEPCSHYGRTPPCSELIINKRVSTVVVGCKDPNPLVSGRGIEKLRNAGIKVITGVCETECRDINRVFNKHIVYKIPYVTIKTAISLDGKVAMPSGESQWITGGAARNRAHQFRSQNQAIAVGANTLKVDNPRLTDRFSELPRQPIKIVYSSKGKIDFQSHFVNDNSTERFLITGNTMDPVDIQKIRNSGITLIIAETAKPGIKWSLQQLYQKGICSVLVEGGAELTASFLKERMVDQVNIFISGKIIGSQEAPGWPGNLGIQMLADVPVVKFAECNFLENDLYISGFLN